MQLFLYLFFSLMLYSCSVDKAGGKLGIGEEGQKEIRAKLGIEAKAKIEVLDFYTVHRCKTCLAIERIAKDLVLEVYGLGSEEVVFRSISLEDNLEMAEYFEVTGTALILHIPSQAEHIDFTDYAFSYALTKPEKLSALLKAELEGQLKML